MRVVSEAVQKRAGALGNRFHHVPSSDHRAQRRVTARDSLPDQNHVRRNAPMIHGEWFARAAHSAHHFIGNQQNSVAAANFSDALHVTIGRSHGTQRSAHHRLENKGSDVLRPVAFQHAIEIVRAIHVTFRIFQPERTAVTKARRDVPPLLQQRRERFAAHHVSRNRKRSQRAAVIALLPRNHAEAFLFAALDPILPRKLDRGFRSFRTTGSKVHTAALAHALRRQREYARGEFFGDGGVKLRRMHVGQPRGLLGHRLRNLRDAMSDGDHRRAARCVQITPPTYGVDEASLSPQRQGISLQKISWEDRFFGHGPPGDQDSRACVLARNISHRSLKDERF